MKDTEKQQQSYDYEPAKIVQIAYNQMSKMSGMRDPCLRTEVPQMAIQTYTFVSTHRILQMPVFAKFTATVSNMYNTVKNSNEMVSSIFTTTEESLEQGVKMVEPVTQKIGSTLEVPLKCVDNILCQGLDYLEEKVPSITETSGIFLANIGNFFRSSVTSLTGFYLTTMQSIQNITAPMSIERSNGNAQHPKVQNN